jgi:hypothetical protein
VAVYVPAIVVAHRSFVNGSFGSARAYYLAMYLPQCALVVVFACRACKHVGRLARAGRPGAPDLPDLPWAKHQRASGSRWQSSKSLLAGMMTGDENEDEGEGEAGRDDAGSDTAPWDRRPSDVVGSVTS